MWQLFPRSSPHLPNHPQTQTHTHIHTHTHMHMHMHTHAELHRRGSQMGTTIFSRCLLIFSLIFSLVTCFQTLLCYSLISLLPPKHSLSLMYTPTHTHTHTHIRTHMHTCMHTGTQAPTLPAQFHVVSPQSLAQCLWLICSTKQAEPHS